MRRLLGVGCLCIFAACTIPSEPAPSARVMPADARALAYGRTTSDVFQNPELRDKIRALFGADWMPAAEARGALAQGAEAYFERGGPLRMVRIGEFDYIAVTGCVSNACQTRRGLLLIREGGSQLFARLDEGGVSRYYAYGGNISADTAGPIVDSSLRTLQTLGDPYPSAGP